MTISQNSLNYLLILFYMYSPQISSLYNKIILIENQEIRIISNNYLNLEWMKSSDLIVLEPKLIWVVIYAFLFIFRVQARLDQYS